MRRLASLLLAMSMLVLGGSRLSASPRQTIGVEPVIVGLPEPDAFTFAPDGRIFWGARKSGKIFIYDPSTGSQTLFFVVPNVVYTFDQGLLGMALHPNYPSTPFLYVYATRDIGAGAQNQILAIRDAGGVGSVYKVIFTSNVVASTAHQGGRILFGPDGMLYAVVGDAEYAPNSQVLSKTAGKILRLTDRGRFPPDNPFRHNPVFVYGIRNGFGFDFDPITGLLWDTDNGPACNDEVDLIQAGQNYGWGGHGNCGEPPSAPLNTNQDGPNPVLPLLWYATPIAVTGAAFCSGCGLPNSEGTLFMGAFNTGELRRLVLTPDRTGIESEEIVYTHPGAIISIEEAPDGTLYFSNGEGIWHLITV